METSNLSTLSTSFRNLLIATALFTGQIPALVQASSLQHTQFLTWAKDKETELKARPSPVDEWTEFNEPVYLPIAAIPAKSVNPLQALRIRNTADLYFQKFGQNTVQSLLWSGIESGNPRTRDDSERWNSLREENLYSSSNRQKLIQALKKAGVRNIRLGMSNHEITNLDDDSQWAATTAMIEDFYNGGLNISLDLHHFGIEDRFRAVDAAGNTIGSKSYYLNPAWPAYFGRFARKVVEKYHRQIKAITIMNEPETVAGFNGEMWHGGFPGWNDSQSNKYYLQRSMQVGKASVMARLEIEDYIAQLPIWQRPHFIYMHTEASVHKLYWSDFNLYRRFIISDMILGGDWLMNADLKALANLPMDQIVGRWGRLNDQTRTILDWVLENYIVYSQQPQDREALRKELIGKLQELQNLHKSLARRFHKTMKTDTVLAIDYYSHNEDRDGNKQRLNPEPQYYAEQIKSGRRVGLYRVMMEYYNHFQMPLMIGESGTPYYYYGARWSQQALLECAKVGQQGIPFLGYTIYPAVDTWGWESALSAPRKQALHNPSGIVDLDFAARPFMGPLVNSLKRKMSTAPDLNEVRVPILTTMKSFGEATLLRLSDIPLL